MIIKGLILGLSIVVPGLSGGTILVVFGLYEKLLTDLLAFKLKPYIPLGIGTILGVFVGSFTITHLLTYYRDATLAFILASILMSIPMILKGTIKVSKSQWLYLILGIVIAYGMIQLTLTDVPSKVGLWEIFVGGIASSGTMILPGISGSSVLMLLGSYEQVLKAINELNLLVLGVYLSGALIGLVSVAKLMQWLFKRYQVQMRYLFSGLIIGSAKLLIPSSFSITAGVAFVMGILLVVIISVLPHRAK